MFNASTNVPVRKFDIFGCIEPPYRALSPHSFCRSLLAVGPAFLGGKGPAVYLWVFSCTDLHKEENRIRNWVNVVVVLGSSLPLERSELRKGRSAGKRDAADQRKMDWELLAYRSTRPWMYSQRVFLMPCPLHPGTFGENR